MNLKHYPGNKSIHGLYQFIINRIPPHEDYYEIFAGSAIIADKLPDTARKTLIDINPEVTDALQAEKRSGTVILNCNALEFLDKFFRSRTVKTNCNPGVQSKATVRLGGRAKSNCTLRKFIYADPPYRFLNRRRKTTNIYKNEWTDNDHEQFLISSSTVKANCMISHPHNAMYDKHLKGWTKEKFRVSYHGIITDECIYYNYPRPTTLQTYKYVGDDCWDRQGVKRKITRLTNKLLSLPELERNAIINRALKK